MNVEQMYTACLSQAAYFIEADGEAAVIDPLRESQPYIDRAERRNATIKYIFETHFHADFVSGHLDLADKTGATIVYGPGADADFEAHIAQDGEEFSLGNTTIKALHTPGHTLESLCYLLFDEEGEEHAIFTGDTLFIGDVGRPDLAQDFAGKSREELAELLFDSLRNKIMPLPDGVLVYPGHGAGSACGKNMSSETVDTLGHQKQTNYALQQDLSREDFVDALLDGLPPPPQYFPKNARINREGYDALDDIVKKGSRKLTADSFEAAARELDALILDTRSPGDFVRGHIPRSINIGLDGRFAPWVGALIEDLERPILLVAGEDRAEEAVTRLSRVGYDHTAGVLKGGIRAWKESGRSLSTINCIDADTFSKNYEKQGGAIIDVRTPSEFSEGHLRGAHNIPLDYIDERMDDIPREQPLYVHCKSGYRSTISASLLRAGGYDRIINIEDGYDALKQTDLAREGGTVSAR